MHRKVPPPVVKIIMAVARLVLSASATQLTSTSQVPACPIWGRLRSVVLTCRCDSRGTDTSTASAGEPGGSTISSVTSSPSTTGVQ